VKIEVSSEVGQLKAVLVHLPGQEHRRILPWNKDSMLFDDIIDIEEARPEHDEFVALLGRQGVRAYYVADLLGKVFADDPEGLSREALGDELGREFLRLRLGPEHLIWGWPRRRSRPEVAGAWPLPNLYFTRDPAFVVRDILFVANPAKPARRREARLLKAVFSRHPEFQGVRICDKFLDTTATVEGGDVHVVDDHSVVVGFGERTNKQGVVGLKDFLFENTDIELVFAIHIPARREFMHLDTVMTFVDRGRVLTLPYMWTQPVCYAAVAENAMSQCRKMRMTYTGARPGVFDDRATMLVYAKGSMRVQTFKDVFKGLAQYGKLTEGATVTVAGSTSEFADRAEHAAEALREQWNDAANVLAVRPGWVVSYGRNDRTCRSLENAGIRVLCFSGGELVRGRGGARCMTMPLERDPI
jgi:arginine deiminase